MGILILLTLLLNASGQVGQVREQTSPDPASQPEGARELVVLVHGLGRTSLSMVPLELALELEGFRVLNWSYSSVCCPIAELSDELEKELQSLPGGTPGRVHFVGHSLGNIIVRWLLTRGDAPENVGNIVMLAPPNQGSHEADRFAPYLSWLLKPLPELQTDRTSTARSLPTIGGVRIGVIAGEDDGKVSPTEVRLAEAAEYAAVPGVHTFLMLRGDVQRLTIGFIRTGRFQKGEE